MLKKIGYFSIAAIVPQLLSLISLFIFVNYLDVNDFAVIAIYESLLLLLQATIGLAMEKACSRYYYEWKDEIISLSSSASLISCFVILILCLFLNLFFGFIEYFNLTNFSFLMLYVASCGYIQVVILLTKYQFQERSRRYLSISLLKTVPFLFVIMIYIFFIEKSSDAFIWGHGITGAFLLIFASYKNKPRLIINEKVYEVLNYSVPFIPTVISAWVMNWSNRLFMTGNVKVETIAIYSFIHKISLVYFLFTTAINLYFIPQIYKSLNEKYDIEKKINYLVLVNIIFVICISIILPIVINYYFDYNKMQIIIMVYTFFLTNYISSILAISTNLILNFNNKTKLQMYNSLFVAIIAVLLNYLLIEKYKLWGIIIAQLVPILILSWMRFYYSGKYSNLKKIKIALNLSIFFYISILFFHLKVVS